MFSLPGPEPVGTMGGGAMVEWLDALQQGGFNLWQILPVPPESRDDCPYAGSSAFAVDPLFLSVEDLAGDGLLPQQVARSALQHAPRGSEAVPWHALRRWKWPLLEAAALAVPDQELERFLERNRWWLDDWALWMALFRHHREPWWRWPQPMRDHEPSALDRARVEHGGTYRQAIALQYLVDRQWGRMRKAMEDRGISLMGDLPIYVDGDGADVWAWRDLFQVGEGAPGGGLVAGVPADAFNPQGQRWDNPVYDWEHSASTGHHWWRTRFRRLMELMDEIRIDHFRGFVEYFAFPAQQTPLDGSWFTGPGRSIFDAMAAELEALRREQGMTLEPELPVVVEDLGHIDQPVHDLRDELRLVGTKVTQFGFDGSPDNPYHPDNFEGELWLAGTGTHDLLPAQAWWDTAPAYVKRNLDAFSRREPGETGSQALVRVTLESRARDTVIPLHDLQGLGAEARINVPGVREGNWIWRAQPITGASVEWCRAMNEATRRTC